MKVNLPQKSHLYPVLCVMLVTWVGCGGSLSADDYDRSCTSDDDCTDILVGDVCDCSCEYGAINKKDEPLYEEDRRSVDCGLFTNDCGPCMSPSVICKDKVCQVKGIP